MSTASGAGSVSRPPSNSVGSTSTNQTGTNAAAASLTIRTSQSANKLSAASTSIGGGAVTPTPAAVAFDKFVVRLESSFGVTSSTQTTVGEKKAVKVTTTSKLDENAADILFEFEKQLTNIDKTILYKHQSSLERLFLSSVLPKCENYVLRTIASTCLCKLLEHNLGNVSNWYHDLLKFLEGSKELGAKIIGLQCFASLTRRFSSQFMLSIPETLTILSKLAKSREELVIKTLILDVITAYYEGTTGSSRAAGSNETTFLDMMKILGRFAQDKSPVVRKKVFEVARNIIYYSIDLRELDSILTIGFKALQAEPEGDIRYAISDSLGDTLSFALRKDHNKINDILKRTNAHLKLPKKLNGEVKSLEDVWLMMEKLLSVTNMKSSTSSSTASTNLALRTSYCHILSRCLRNMCSNNCFNLANGAVRLGLEGTLATVKDSGNENLIDESNLVNQVTRWMSLLSKKSFVTGASTGVLIGGPASQAAFSLPATAKDQPQIDIPADQNTRQMMSCIYSGLITHLLPFQTERALEAVGKSVVAYLNVIIKQLQAAPAQNTLQNDLIINYQVLLSFHILSFIFSKLGLAIEYLELKDQCLEVLLFFLNHSQYFIRVSAAQCFRSLARAASPQIATWLSVIYKIVVMQLVEATDSLENSAGSKKLVDIDPVPYYSLHGHISALTAIVGVIPESVCGVPSSILESIYDVAKKLLGLNPSTESGAPAASSQQTTITPSPHTHAHLHILLEGGWTLLSSLISLGFEWNSSRFNSLFVLWRGCLGKKPISGKQKQEDINLELKVRCKALVALRSFIQVMRFRMQMILVQDQWVPSPLLKATIIFLRNTFALLKALTAEKSLDPSVALSLSQLKAISMDCFAGLPPSSYAPSFVQLLHMVVSEFTSKNPPLSSELNRILTKADHNLNAPAISAGASGGSDETLVRFMDLHDSSDTNPIPSALTGLPGPSPTSFYEIVCGGGMVVPDYSWNWCLRAQVHTEVRKELQNLGGGASGSSNGSSTPNNANVETPTSPTPLSPMESSSTLPSEDSFNEKALDGLNTGDNTGFDDRGLGDDLDGFDPDGNISSRPLWSSLRNHADRFTINQHATECYETPAIRSVNACIRLFGTIFADQSTTHQEQLSKHFLAIVTKAKAMNSLYSNIVTNVATALLGIARDLSERDVSLRSPAAMDILLQIASELMPSANPLVRRAIGEALGLLVRSSSGDELLSKLVTSLQTHLYSKDQSAITTSVFALGCIHRYGGAMKTMRHLPFTVAALQSLGRDFSEPFRIWILHSLWLAIDTGGLSFAAYVQPTLAILSAQANHDIETRTPAVSQTIGRILHAVIGALGPDIAMAASGMGGGSGGVDKFLNLWQHLRLTQLDSNPGTQVEIVGVLHQLVMWSPPGEQAQQLPLLVQALSSEDEELRRQAVRTLLQFGEKESKSLMKFDLDRRIMSMIETEQTAGMLALIKHTISSWISNSGYDNDSSSATSPADSIRVRLFDICKRAVVGGHKLPSDSQVTGGGNNESKYQLKDQSKPSSPTTTPHGGDETKEDDDEEDDGNILDESAASPRKKTNKSDASSSSSTSSGEGSNLDQVFIPSETRWQTKSFALDGLAALLKVSYKSCDHATEFNLKYARRYGKFPLQYVVQQLPDLLTVACLATSSVYDPLRIKGTCLMKTIVEVFGDVPDPDAVEIEHDPDVGSSSGGELLLQLYSAQVTSALSQSMKNKNETAPNLLSAPQLRSKSCELAVTYLSSGVTVDPIVFSRIIKLLLSPLLNPDEILSNLNNQFDGQMSTLVILAHLNALGMLHSLVLESPQLTNPTSSSSRRKGTKPLTPKQQAIVVIRDTLATSFPLLTLHYFQALKDYILVSTLSRKELSKLKGFYFDGSTTANPLPVYLNYWEVCLKNLCKTLELDGNGAGRSKHDDSSLSRIIASDGSIGGERSKQELIHICLGVITNSLTLIASHEGKTAATTTTSAGGPHRTGSVDGKAGGRSFSDKLKRSANLDSTTLTKTDRERDSSCVLACISGLHGLFQVGHFTQGRITIQILHELLPLLTWNLSHRPAGAEVPTLAKRQSAVLNIIQTLFSTLKELVEDESKYEAFLAASSAAATAASTQLSEGEPLFDSATSASSSTTAITSLKTLLHSLNETVSATVYAFLPVYGSVSSPAMYETNLTKLNEGGTYFSQDVVSTLDRLLGFLPQLLEIVTKATELEVSKNEATVDEFEVDQRLSSQLVLLLNLCLHYIRKSTLDLSQSALHTLLTLLFHQSLMKDSNGEAQNRILPPAILTQQLTQQIRNVLLNPLPLNTDFRVELLLAAFYHLITATLPDTSSDDDRASALTTFSTVWTEFQQHPGSRFRLIALNSLQRYILTVPDASVATTTLAHTQRSLLALLQQLSKTLLVCIHTSDVGDESIAAVQSVIHIFHAFHSSLEEGEAIKVAWLPLLLPLLVDHLARVPNSITNVLALATSLPILFKSNVALLPLDYRTRLQTCVMSMTPAQQQAAMTQVAQIQAKQSKTATNTIDGSEAEATKANKKASKKQRESSSSTSTGSTLAASSSGPSSSIALSMDFSHFKKK